MVGDAPGGVAGPAGAVDDVGVGQAAHRAQHVHLPVAQVPLAEGQRWLHGDQAEDLQQVVLDHVLERADVVVVAGPALQGEGLVPDDVHLGDVGAVPDRFHDPVGEPAAEQVLHGGHGQEVVDAEHRLLGEHVGEQPVELLGVPQALPERLLRHDAAAPGQSGLVQGGHGGGEERGRQGQVDGDRVVAGDEGGHLGGVGDVGLAVVAGGRDGAHGVVGKAGAVACELVGGPLPVPVAVPVLPAAGGQAEPVVDVPGGVQGGQGRQEVAPGQVAGAAEDDESSDVHRAPPFPRAVRRAESAPAARTPVRPIAWGKLPMIAPVIGSAARAPLRSPPGLLLLTLTEAAAGRNRAPWRLVRSGHLAGWILRAVRRVGS